MTPDVMICKQLSKDEWQRADIYSYCSIVYYIYNGELINDNDNFSEEDKTTYQYIVIFKRLNYAEYNNTGHYGLCDLFIAGWCELVHVNSAFINDYLNNHLLMDIDDEKI